MCLKTVFTFLTLIKTVKRCFFKGLKTDFLFLATVVKFATVRKIRTVQLVGNIDRFKEFK